MDNWDYRLLGTINSWSISGAERYYYVRIIYLSLFILGDNNDNIGIHIALSIDGITWDKTDTLFALVRNDGGGKNFDSNNNYYYSNTTILRKVIGKDKPLFNVNIVLDS